MKKIGSVGEAVHLMEREKPRDEERDRKKHSKEKERGREKVSDLKYGVMPCLVETVCVRM